jgi:septal ring factor EnvC (AmiA/AmiB activator)
LTKKVDDQEKIIQKMQKTIDENDQILENLRTTMEKDAMKVNALEQEAKRLKTEGTRKDQLIEK